jgi:hypothetical protein
MTLCASNGIAVKFEIDEGARARCAQRLVVAALDDAEQRPARSGVLERAPASLGPAQRKIHGALDFAPLSRKFDAFVELHGDVRAKQDLHFDGALRRQLHHRAVEMGTESHAAFAHLPQRRQRHYLEAAGISQDRMGPAHEGVQAAKRRNPFGRRPKHQMVGIGQQNLGARATHVVMVHTLDGGLRADRHEGRRVYQTMGRRYLAGAGSTVDRSEVEGESARSTHGFSPVTFSARNSKQASP